MSVKWTEEQQKVIDLRNRNILVSAAAGSGKTAVLVERIIQMLTDREHPVDVDRLLIVTFTEAAAAEMKERIREAIEKALEADPGNANLQRQATLIHSAPITTIHSFCLSVIREHFHVIDLDPGFRIGEDGELKLLKQVIKNPLIIATLLGIIFIILKINIPKPIYKTLSDISKIATPLAFIVLGAELEFGNMVKNIKYLISANILRLIGNPLITVGVGKLVGFQGIELVALLSMSACPTAVASYTMAKEMNADGDLAGEIVATTSMLSIFTIFCWVLILKNLEWI